MKRIVVGAMLAALLFQAGCATESGRDAAIGSGIGAGIGAVLGNNLGNSRNDRELGIAAGALLGGLLGHTYGKQQEMQGQVNNVQQNQMMETIWITNSNGSKTPVLLRKSDGGQYIGPRGEYYQGRPTDEQLKQVYGM